MVESVSIIPNSYHLIRTYNIMGNSELGPKVSEIKKTSGGSHSIRG